MSGHGRIMCAVDLSWRSESAFNHAVALASHGARRWTCCLLFLLDFHSAGGHASASRSLPNSVGAPQRPMST